MMLNLSSRLELTAITHLTLLICIVSRVWPVCVASSSGKGAKATQQAGLIDGQAKRNVSQSGISSEATRSGTPSNVTLTDQSDVKMRIAGGYRIRITDCAYQAFLRRIKDKDPYSRCGGSIIGDKWILTAAHCLFYEGVRGKPEDFSVAVGIANIKDAKYLPVERLHIHDGFDINASIPYRTSDIAIIELKDQLKFSDRVKKIPLPVMKEEEQYAGKANRAVVSGWGLYDRRRKPRDYLQAAGMTILPREKCQEILPEGLAERIICAAQFGLGERGDSCQGDSGGPLVVTSTGNVYVLVGIVAGGHSICGFKNPPGEYTKVSYYLEWICKIITCSG